MDKFFRSFEFVLCLVSFVCSIYAVCVANKALEICSDTQKEINMKLDKLDNSLSLLNGYCERISNDIINDNNVTFYGVGVGNINRNSR